MSLFRRGLLMGAVIAAAPLTLSEPAFAQGAYPNKPITLVVPAAAGGPTDTVGRLIAESMGKTLVQTVVVENVGGAGGTIGKAKVSSVPDLPTLDGGTLPGFEVSAWHALWAPKGLPKDVTEKLVAALKVALKDPKVVERFAGLGTEPVAESQVSPEALKTYLEAEVKRWDAVIKAAGVKGSN